MSNAGPEAVGILECILYNAGPEVGGIPECLDDGPEAGGTPECLTLARRQGEHQSV